ncbi:MAG: hypothetical protein DLM70_05950 [Chloroflexi bacterium]|nr:MAG: hypothetical protein DLM70_05950 [Chloroflexota bacterium]
MGERSDAGRLCPSNMQATSLASLGVVLVFGALGTWWVVGRALMPVRRVNRAAQEIGMETLHRRLALTGPDDELKRLGDAFDAMLNRLQEGIDRDAASPRTPPTNCGRHSRSCAPISRWFVPIRARQSATTGTCPRPSTGPSRGWSA